MSDCGAFLRPLLSPFAALTFSVSEDVDPDDWPMAQGPRVIDSQLGHAGGWGCEVRANDIILLDPLGEGVLKAHRPKLTDAWIHQIRSTNSAAIFLVPESKIAESKVPEFKVPEFKVPEFKVTAVGDSGQGSAEWALDVLAGISIAIRAATVRTSISSDALRPPKVGRNDPCHCGSGKKFKQCHGRN